MTKVCFYTVQYLEDARHTADNLMIAKMMSDYGKPLRPDMKFFVQGGNDNTFFEEALNSLFQSVTIEEDDVEEKVKVLLSSAEIERWLQLTTRIQDTSTFEAFRMARKGLETTLELSSDFDCEMKGEFTDLGLSLEISGYSYYILYSEILEGIITFKDSLNQQLPIWEGIYYEHNQGSKRDTYYAS